jgi:hypothetical protein
MIPGRRRNWAAEEVSGEELGGEVLEDEELRVSRCSWAWPSNGMTNNE